MSYRLHHQSNIHDAGSSALNCVEPRRNNLYSFTLLIVCMGRRTVGSRHLFSFGSAVLLGSTGVAASAQAQNPNWTFWYAGGHAGYDWTSIDVQNIGSINADGFAGGVLAGVNFYQSGNFVAGIETDITWLRGKGIVDPQMPPGSGMGCNFGQPSSTTVSADVNWKATLRGRAGYLVNPAVFVFATAGPAWADVDFSTIGSPSEKCSAGTTFFGGVVGGGTEMQLSGNLYGRVEVLHYMFGDETVKFDDRTSYKMDLDETVARIGVTLRFN